MTSNPSSVKQPTAVESPGVFFYDYNLQESDQRSEILQGLRKPQKTISAKYFYDEKGSNLFEAITDLPEYYPTRTEIGLLKKYSQQIIEEAGQDSVLIEYGSGASTKIRLLLESLKPKAYVPMDISKDFLYECAIQLRKEYPWLEIHATCLDFKEQARLPSRINKQAKRIAFFPGSSLGNFSPEEATKFLKGVRETVGDEGALLIGIDLDKDVSTLEAAYNDAQGVTALFNLNILNHINQLGSGSFNPEHFEHNAFYNQEEQRIEMHLVSQFDQVASIYGERISLKAGETILTEYSHKYRADQFLDDVRQAGFLGKHFWTDDKQNFGLFWLEADSL